MKQYLALAFALIIPTETAQAASFSTTETYQTIEEVWTWFINQLGEPQHTVQIDYYLGLELDHYSKQRGYLWPENRKAVEAQLKKHREGWRKDPTTIVPQHYFFPYRGLVSFTAPEARRYYDITAHHNHFARKEEADAIDLTSYLESLMFETYFQSYQAYGKNLLNNTNGPMYAVFYGPLEEAAEAYEELRELCTPTNKMLNKRGKLVKMDRASTFEDISVAFYTLTMMELNQRIALNFRNNFTKNVELPLKPYIDLSSAYLEEDLPWPESRRGYVDQCRLDFESAGRLEVLIARSKE